MGEINRAAVIGAGTMGAGIAGHLANAGVPVTLLDIVPDGATDRDAVAKRAVERLLASSPPALMHPDRAKLIATGNVEDDLGLLAEADWIAEAVVERLEVKRALYLKIDAARKAGALVSSNTSTIPLSLLTRDMPAGLVPDFAITHFFNPVRYMRLLELVAGPKTRPEAAATLAAFCDERLGKGVVRCSDTPGFLANRVGCYALQVAMVEAEALGLTVEEADAVMGRPMGIPKTGVFGLYDLIGLDLMLDVCRSLAAALPADDPFQSVAGGIAATHRLVAEGRTGLKAGAGFYRDGADGTRQAVDLASGHYCAARRPDLEAASAGETDGLGALVDRPDKYGTFAWRVLACVLSYAASLVPEVSDDPDAIDEAMRLGYNWARGPFEMIDALGVDWFRAGLARDGLAVPAFLAAATGGGFYRAAAGRLEALRPDGKYRPVVRPPGVVRLGDVMRAGAPLLDNGAARLWDVGEGVACLEFHTKANALVPESMALLYESLGVVGRDFRALVIHNDAPHFSMGVNLEFVLGAAEARDWARLETMLVEFQATCAAMRGAPFPVVAAPAGMALGGGCEVVLHCDAVVAHANVTLGQVETLVGLIPGGGGAKEMLSRWRDGPETPPGVEAAVTTFRLVGTGRTASSPDEARPLRLMLARDQAVMNRDRLLAAARERALAMAEGYAPPPAPTFAALGPAGYQALQGVLDRLAEKGIATPHDHVVGGQLARILCGGDRPAGTPVSEEEVFAIEREAFLHLAGTEATRARIRHMLEYGKPLRN